MAHHYTPTPSKTYATEANAVKAVEKLYGPNEEMGAAKLHYIVMQDAEGRFFPVFYGERAIQQQAFRHFSVIA